jgi:protein TonB
MYNANHSHLHLMRKPMTSTMADYLINPKGEQSCVETPFNTASKRPAGQIQVIAAIVLLHVLIIYALNHGVIKHKDVPVMAFITLISPQPAMPAAKSPTRPAIQRSTIPAVEPVVLPSTESPVTEPPRTQISTPTPVEIAAPAIQTPSEPKLISSAIQYLRAPQPAYPTLSRRLREQGKTLVRVLINTEGLAEKAEIQQSSGFARLDEAARQAVLNALFKPFAENGQPVAVYAVIPIQFHLDS